MKVCSHCQRELPLYAFTRDRSRPDGRFSWCAECKSENRKQAYLATHPERRAKIYDAPKGQAKKFKLCIDCLQEKPLSHFHRKRDAADKRTSYCKPCGNARSAKWQLENKEKTAPRRLAWRQSSPRQSLNVSRIGALSRCRISTDNPVTLDELMAIWNAQGGRCALSGIQMTWAQGKLLPTSITLDRLDQSKGYSADNIRLLCHAVNSFRGLMSDAEMLTMARAIVDNMSACSREPSWQPHVISSEAA